MLKSFYGSREWALWAWGGMALLLASIYAQVQMVVLINNWYRETWDLLGAAAGFGEAQESVDGIRQIGMLLLEFCAIAFPYVLLGVLSSFFGQHYAFRWRQAITFAYRPYWEKTEKEVEGASQRMQEDPARFAVVVESLGLGLFRAVLTLIAFIPILWNLSEQLSMEINGKQEELDKTLAAVSAEDASMIEFALIGVRYVADVPGSLMWIAIGIAVFGTCLSYFVGIKLPGLHYNNQKVEARFRKRLVYAEDDKKFADMPSMLELFTGLRFNYFRLYLHSSYFGLWSGFFAQFVIIIDFILLAPGVLVAGLITVGVINQVGHAFGKVTESLAYFVDRWVDVTELLSIIKRLREFEGNIGYNGKTPISTEGVQIVR